MVKYPSTDEATLKGIENRTQFAHDLGGFLMIWGHFEFAVEIRIAELARLTALRGSIVLASLNSGARFAILHSLLAEFGTKAESDAVRAAITFAKRNALIHSSLASEKHFSEFGFYQRRVDNSYKVTLQRYTADEFHERFKKVCELAEKATEAMGITPKKMNSYGQRARFPDVRSRRQ